MPRPDFSTLMPPDDARRLLAEHLSPLAGSEELPTIEAVGRTLAADVASAQTMPDFRRSTVDGYALKAADTPGSLRVIGEVPMGTLADFTLQAGQAALVHTGGNVPDGADAVVMVEETQREGDTLHTTASLSPGENVIQIGEDISAGDVILRRGHRLRTQDVGGLLGIGVTQVTAARQPRVAIFSSGDEVVPPDQPTQPGQVRDINSSTIALLTRQAGGIAEVGGILPDDYAAIHQRLKAALDGGAGALVVTAGSSMSERDVTADVFNALGQPGVLVHGIATKPGKPTILGMVGPVPVIGLPGNPMSAFVQFSVMVVPILTRLQGGTPQAPFEVPARLLGDVYSLAGREDYVPAKLIHSPNGPQAQPIAFKSNLIFKLVEANALIHVPAEPAHLKAGTTVAVRLL